MKKILLIIFIIAIFLIGCSNENSNDELTSTQKPEITIEPTEITQLPIIDEADFEDGNNGFIHGFADYPKGEEEFYELNAKVSEIPNLATNGYMLSGNNHSDDLLMFIVKSYDLEPNTSYDVTLSFDVATNVPGGMMGVGGSPGSSVYVKAGASNKSLELIEDDIKHLRINWDIGNQASDGTEGVTLGNIEKENSEDESYQLKRFEKTFTVTTTESGQIHILIGIDSGFESLSMVYIDNINIHIS